MQKAYARQYDGSEVQRATSQYRAKTRNLDFVPVHVWWCNMLFEPSSYTWVVLVSSKSSKLAHQNKEMLRIY